MLRGSNQNSSIVSGLYCSAHLQIPFEHSAGYSHVPQSSPTKLVPGSLQRPSLVGRKPVRHVQIPESQLAYSEIHLVCASQFSPILEAEKTNKNHVEIAFVINDNDCSSLRQGRLIQTLLLHSVYQTNETAEYYIFDCLHNVIVYINQFVQFISIELMHFC